MLEVRSSEYMAKRPSNRHKYKTVRHECVAEFIGTAIIIIFGCGVVAAANASPSLPLADAFGKMLYINSSWALAVTFGIMASFDTSGAHLNTAVTLNAIVNGGFPLKKGLSFMVAQLLGAIFGALVVTLNFVVFKGGDVLSNFYCTAPASNVNFYNAAFNEFVATFLLQFSIMGITNHHPAFNKFHVAGFVGALVFVIGNTFGPLTGYALNPARDLGPRLTYLTFLVLYGKTSPLAVFANNGYFLIPIIFPCLGAIAAGFTYKRAIYIDDGEQADEAWGMEHLGDANSDDEESM
eukprot:TRINITY_DN45938_c0_g1_i1.p1 TRINITY_DN45938_c0_g1~~TRINITY_DN45938_c0_g1_i1.p1  ORF type:complete len:294 (+),score=67.53 TRINITY_DN45938_c0_g1_i1:84-965(+)